MEIQVDFEGRNPIDPDFDGIKTLLQRLFLKSFVDINSLTDLIIKQNYVGSVIKQSSEDQMESDDEDDDVNDVFGVTTVINISENDATCVDQLRTQLIELANENADEETRKIVKNLLESDSLIVGLLINERFVNIPAQISVPLIENLVSEIRRAVSKKMPFDFTHYMLICKIYRPKKQPKSNKKVISSDIVWSNPEEEIFAELSTASFEFSVEKRFDSGLSGEWSEEDEELIPCRRVLIFEASKLQNILNSIKSQISVPSVIHSK